MQCSLTTVDLHNNVESEFPSQSQAELQLEESLVEAGPCKTDPMEELGMFAPYGQDRLSSQRETKRRD